jgi:hypothetical protein
MPHCRVSFFAVNIYCHMVPLFYLFSSLICYVLFRYRCGFVIMSLGYRTTLVEKRTIP